jgi:hypothetical protein
MKKISKMALLAVAGMISLPQAFAQEAEEETFATEESEYTADFGDDFGGGFDDFGSDDSAPTYYINAETGVDMRGYIGTYDGSAFNSGYETKSQAEVFDSLTDASAYANMTLGYSAQNSEMEFKLKFDGNSLGDYNQDILDEATARLFLGNWVIEGGKMKVVWGKGDKLHVLDNFNANDYTDFIFGDYIDRRIAEPMLRVKYNVPNTNWSVEGVYTPMMTADRFASSGVWAPAAQTTMTSTISDSAKKLLASAISDLEEARNTAAVAASLKAAGNDTALSTMVASALTKGKIENYTTADIIAYCTKNGLDPTVAANQTTAAKAILADRYETYLTNELTAANTTYTNALNNASAMSSDSSVLYPDTNQLRYGQAGIRVLGTVGSVDLGASYYYGHYKQPSFNATKLESALTTYLTTGELSEDEKFLAYDQKQTFGLEAAFVVWKFNTRWELGYNLTKDSAGDNPWVHNNSIEWLGGFDVNLPIHNMNLNVQETGKYILNNDKIEDGAYKVYDVDYNSDGKYINNRVVMNLSDNFLYENLKPEVTVIWGIENNEWCVQPKVNYKVADGMNLGVSGGVLYCYNENGEFYNFTADSTKWHTKSFVQASVRYEF